MAASSSCLQSLGNRNSGFAGEVTNCIDFCIEFCRRDDLSRLDAGKLICVVNHSSPLRYNCYAVAHSLLLVFNSGLEEREPQSAHHQLAKKSHDFQRQPAFFVDVYLTTRVRVKKLVVIGDFTFGRIQRIFGGTKLLPYSGGKNKETTAIDEIWVPSWCRNVSNADAAGPMLLLPNGSSDFSARCDVLRFEIATWPTVDCAYNLCRARLVIRPSRPTENKAQPQPTTPAIKNLLTSQQSAIAAPKLQQNESTSPQFNLADCPEDIFIDVINKLPEEERFKTMVSLSSCCRRFYDILRRPTLFASLDLNLASLCLASCGATTKTSSVLSYLIKRASQVRHLRISSLPSLPAFCPLRSLFSRILPNCLLSFAANCSPVITDAIISVIVNQQHQLKLLSLSGCHALTTNIFGEIANLKNLRVLQLQDVAMEPVALEKIANNCRQLEHLTLGRLPAFLRNSLPVSSRKQMSWPETVDRMKRLNDGTSVYIAKVYSFDAGLLKLANNVGSISLRSISLDASCFTDLASLYTFVTKCRRVENLFIESFPSRKNSVTSNQQHASFCQLLVDSCPNLRDLFIGSSHRPFPIGTEEAKLLSKLVNLKRIRVEKAELTFQDVEFLLKSLRCLVSISLSGSRIMPWQLQRLRLSFPTRRIDYFQLEEEIGENNMVDSGENNAGFVDNNGEDDEIMDIDDPRDNNGVIEFETESDDPDEEVDVEANDDENAAPASDSEYDLEELGRLRNDCWIYHVNEYCKRNSPLAAPIGAHGNNAANYRPHLEFAQQDLPEEGKSLFEIDFSQYE